MSVHATRSPDLATHTYAVAPVLRILVVIDGRIRLDKGPTEFGLGYVLDTLTDPGWGPAQIEFGIVTREASIADESRDGRDVLHVGFRFDQEGFHIDEWDQIWIFADRPNLDDGGPLDTDARIGPPYVLEDDEALVLAEWMERGGGVFATGDHGVLGASLCHRIPRVRTMRRWRIADGVPARDGSRKNQTWQGPDPDWPNETDRLLQPVELVTKRVTGSLPFLSLRRPHPLMCSSEGPITEFPDHMHEGELVPDDEVDLERPLGIPGYERPEYPEAVPKVLALSLGPATEAIVRPRPSIVAFGYTTNPRYLDIVEPGQLAGAILFRPALPPKRFGLVSAYDGDPVGLGRVVCDSTWHHWLSINLHTLAEDGGPVYRKMQAYYRNVALWLARASQRRSMSVAAVWTALTHNGPVAFSERRTSWALGERTLMLLGEWLSPCWVDELVNVQVNATSMVLARSTDDDDPWAPQWGSMPEDLVHRAVVGAMCKALLPTAMEVLGERTLRDDVGVDVAAIETLAAAAVGDVPRLIRESLDGAIEGLEWLRNGVTEAEERWTGPPMDGAGQ